MKKLQISPFINWRSEIEGAEVAAIDNDIILLDKPIITSRFDYPFKVDVTTAIICLKGTTDGAINLIPFKTEAPCLITVLADQILEHRHISDDFEGLFIVMSRRFTDSLMPSVQDRLPLFLSVRNNPCTPLSTESLEAMVSYFEMLKRMIGVKDSPYRVEVARHLTLAFFYGAGFHSEDLANSNSNPSHQEALMDRFLKQVQASYKHQRELIFYADKLCLTPKHLSKVVKETSGKSANDWIDEYVTLEAKALLKSTNKTIQQISDELNFPSQSFFGKYFKRVVGISPKEYKRS